MASSNISWGIEIGAGGVRAIKLAADGDQVRVLEFVSFDHPKVLSTPELDQDDAMRVAIGTLASRFDLSGAQVAISIPGHQSFARFAKLPPVEPKKIPDIVKFEAVQQIPFPLEDVEWDYQTFLSPDSPEVEVGIFAVTRDRIQERLRLLEDVGITPDIATLSPISVYNALAYDLDFTQQTPGTILLDVGTMATDLVIAHAGRVWVRTFPIGGHQFTETLVETFKVPYSKAEKLKREAEQTKHARHVFQAMRPVFTDLVQEVQRSIGYYQSLHPDADLKRLIGAGSTFRLPGLRKYLKQQLQLDVYRLEQFKKLTVDDARAGEFQVASLNLASAYGLALQGLGLATLNANLMPVEMVRDAMWKRKIGWFGAAAAVAALASAAMFIRPMLDSAAVTAAGTPALFGQAINEANAARGRATEAGVLTETGQTLSAEQMIGLVDTDQLYASIVGDLGQMFAHAQTVGQGDIPAGVPAFSLEVLDTQYSLGEGGAEPKAAAMPDYGEDPYAGEGFSEMAQMPTRAQPRRTVTRSTVGGVPEEVRAHRHVRVEMQVTTPHPQPMDFVINSIEVWLKENEKRADMPYSIWYDPNAMAFTELDPAAASSTRTAGRPRPGGTGGAPQEIVPSGGGVEDARLPSGPQTRSTVSSPRSNVNIDQLAPIEPPAATAGGATGQFTIVWYLLLEEPAADTQEVDE